jgi:nitrous oxidase accessory protein
MIESHARTGLAVAFVAALAGLWLACSTCTRATPSVRAAVPAAPPRPSDCVEIGAGPGLQAALDAAAEGAALCLAPGRHDGPIRLDRRMRVWGPPEAAIVSRGEGSTVDIVADGVELLGVTVDGSGHRFDLLDAAVRVHAADVRIEGVQIIRATFGILVEKSRRAVVRGNVVAGNPGVTVGMRGDSIRLWETTDSVVEGNQVLDGRDVVVWYSSRNRIIDNRIVRSRYGTHLMYSSDCEVAGNRYEADVVGAFVMYSHRVRVHDNIVVGAAASAEMAVGLKDSGDVTLERNGLVHAGIGLYLDGNPPPGEVNRIAGNAVQLCDTAIVFHAGGARVELIGNELSDNQVAVRVDGRGDALGVTWDGNYFDDYVGYDLDGDGIGDLPYELRSLSGELMSRYPNLAFFRGAPSLALTDAVTHLVPLLQPPALLRDPRPRMSPPRILESIR